MAEQESKVDRIMANIKKQAIITGIKTALKKYPQARQFLPFLKEGIESAKLQSETYLGEAEKIIVIGRKLGTTRILVIDATKRFSISTGLKVDYDADKPETILFNKEVDMYLNEVYSSGIFDEITEEDNKKFLEMKEKGFENLLDTQFLEQKQVETDNG